MTDGVPQTYTELWQAYFPYVRSLVHQRGVSESDDVASEIMLRFFARDMLSKYDPTIVSHGKRTNFKAFLRGFVVSYSLGFRDAEGKRSHREPLKCDQPISSETATVWIEVNAPAHMDEHGELDNSQMVTLIRERLGELPTRGRKGKGQDHLRLFELMLPQIQKYGEIDRLVLSKQFGVSTSVIGSMIQEIREALSFLSTSTSAPTVIKF